MSAVLQSLAKPQAEPRPCEGKQMALCWCLPILIVDGEMFLWSCWAKLFFENRSIKHPNKHVHSYLQNDVKAMFSAFVMCKFLGIM